jgi:anti-sigma B factor antagonist
MTDDGSARTLSGERGTTQLKARVRRVGLGVVRVEVSGEIDMTNAPDLAVVLRHAVDSRPERLEVDLSGVTFLGCAGVCALLAAQRATSALVVIAVPRAARRLLAIAGLLVS